MALKPISRLLAAFVLAGLVAIPSPALASRVCDAGAGNYLTAAHIAAYDLSNTDDFTFALAVKLATTAGYQMLLNKSDAVGTNSDFALSHWDDKTLHLAVANFGGSLTNGVTSINDTTTWHYLAVKGTSGGSDWQFFVDGVASGAATGSTFSSPNAWAVNVCGPPQAGHTTLAGKVALVNIWTTKLSDADILALTTSSTPHLIGSGNVASWPMCEPNDLDDRSSNDNDLTVVGGGTVLTSTDNPAACTPSATTKGPIGGGVGGPIISGGSGGF